MQGASDDLTKPLGAEVDERKPSRLAAALSTVAAKVPLTRIAFGFFALLAAGIGGWLAISDDPLGGEPHVVVEIRDGAPPADTDDVEPASPPRSGLALIQDMSQRPRGSAAEIESRSGVDVMRPDGSAESGALIIEIPQDGSAAPRPGEAVTAGLAPAPDPRLVERTRYGLLPRIGDDGTMPWRYYARPAAPSVAGNVGRVAILVTGMGISQVATAEAIDLLPEDVSFAFAPYGGDLSRHVARAREEGHEVFLQAPMEPFDYPASDPGPHTLTTTAERQENADRLAWVMGRITGYVGIVNFMGGRLTASEPAFAPILDEIAGRGLAYVDDGSTTRSLAARLAPDLRLPTVSADIVLDPVPDPARVEEALARLEAMAKERGFAVASASALPSTVERIAAWVAAAEARGISLVPVSATLTVPTGG